jgi:AcrR family transcriptional regulator
MAQTMKRPGKTKDREFPKYLPQAERERYILDRTVAVFAEHGLSIGTREIAAKIGVTQSLLYKYFASKDALIEAVFQEVFLKRWNNSWEALLRDRSRSIEDRLCTYLVDYSETIMDKSWVRIFLFGALAKMALHRRYLDKLIKDTFLVILDELYVEFGVDKNRTQRERELDLEVIWGFHASFFYLGVRQWVYDLPIKQPLEDIVRARLRAFIGGIGCYLDEKARRPIGSKQRP